MVNEAQRNPDRRKWLWILAVCVVVALLAFRVFVENVWAADLGFYSDANNPKRLYHERWANYSAIAQILSIGAIVGIALKLIIAFARRKREPFEV